MSLAVKMMMRKKVATVLSRLNLLATGSEATLATRDIGWYLILRAMVMEVLSFPRLTQVVITLFLIILRCPGDTIHPSSIFSFILQTLRVMPSLYCRLVVAL